MTFDLRRCVVQITDPDGQSSAGSGFIVAPDLVVTCAHVLEDLEAKPGAIVRLVFATGGSLEAEIPANGWYPDKDVAFLKLKRVLPDEAEPASLRAVESSTGQSYIALGYPEDGEVQARWPQGHIGGVTPVEGWPFDLIQLQGAEVDRGLSGAPVLDLQDNRVVGMITGMKTLSGRQPDDPKVRYAYAIPAKVIARLCPVPLKLHPVARPVDLPPLSVHPRTERPHIDVPLIGRDDDLAWLSELKTDALLVGQPGSGKTHLLRQLMASEKALFVVSDDIKAIASYLSTHAPPVVIVDDAHYHHQLLPDLVRVRHELEGVFYILATCWPSHRTSVMQTLSLSESEVRDLQLLTRDQIAEIVQIVIPRVTTPLVREIVNQAEGRPGLAVTLADLCKRGDIQQVVLGDALNRSFFTLFGENKQVRLSQILATFSVGGEDGLPMTSVAEALSMSVVDLREEVKALDAAGIIFESREGQLSVRPPALRFVLVREMFLGGATSLPLQLLERLIDAAPNHPEVVNTLIGARARNADVPSAWLANQVESVHAPFVWRNYASLGAAEASWVLTQHPDWIDEVARPSLLRAPDVALPLLFTQAVGDERALHAHPDHPLRIIEDWIHAGLPGTGEALRRRESLLTAVKEWLTAGEDVSVGFRALQWVVTPRWQDQDQDPGSGNKLTLRGGLLSLDEIRAVQSLWPQALEIIQMSSAPDWSAVRALVDVWVYPSRGMFRSSSECYNAARAFAGTLIRDLLPLFTSQPGLCHWAAGIVKHLGEDIEVPVDAEFEVLYPQREFEDAEDWRAEQDAQRKAVTDLAHTWTNTLSPREVVERLAWFQSEAQLAGNAWSDWTFGFCHQLAEATEDPIAWVDLFLSTSLPSAYVEPFLRRAAENSDPDWELSAMKCLSHNLLRYAALSLILSHPTPPEKLLEAALDNLEGHAELVRGLCIRERVSEAVLRCLLQHPDGAIVGAAAVSLWYADPKDEVPAALLEDWEAAIVRGGEDDHTLSQILMKDPLLAERWLEARFREGVVVFSYRHEKSYRAAFGSLDIAARRRLMGMLPDDWIPPEFISGLIGDSPELYGEFLANPRHHPHHLFPLARVPEGIWFTFASMALKSGHRPEEIATMTHSPSGISWTWESDTDHWQKWVERFEALVEHEDPGIRSVGHAGRKSAQFQLDRALREELNEAVYGRF